MDDPACDRELLLNTVRQFEGINRLLSSSRRLIRKHLVSRMSPGTDRPYTLLDIGAGGGDIACWLADYCKKRGINIRITCLDNDPWIADFARQNIAGRGNIEIIEASIFDLPRSVRYDFVFSNHFLHHFDEEDILRILDRLLITARRTLLMNDLLRSKLSYLGYRLCAALFLHHSFAARDGALSIRRGFLPRELEQLLTRTDRPDLLEVWQAVPGRIYILGAPGAD